MTTSYKPAVDNELLEEIIVEVCDAPIQDELSADDAKTQARGNLVCEELESIGITTIENWQDRMYGVADSDAEFLQEMLDDHGDLQDVPEYLVIDWQESWDRNYRFDFNVIVFEGTRWYFFNS